MYHTLIPSLTFLSFVSATCTTTLVPSRARRADTHTTHPRAGAYLAFRTMRAVQQRLSTAETRRTNAPPWQGRRRLGGDGGAADSAAMTWWARGNGYLFFSEASSSLFSGSERTNDAPDDRVVERLRIA